MPDNIDETYYDSLSLLTKMIATPSVSRDESAVADLIEAQMRQWQLQPQRSGNNLWLTAPGYDPARPTLLLCSHIDTVKPNPAWSRDPFTPTDEDGRLYGLGSNDAGASVVSLLAAYRILSEQEQSYNLIFLASCQEEVSGDGGVQSVLPQLPPITAAIIGEPTGMQPAIAEKGLMVLDGLATGVAGHAARNEGVNAIYKAIDAINALRGLRFERTSRLLGPVKISITVINAGTQHNVVPAECRFLVDVRTTDAYTNLETLALMRQAAPTCTLTPHSTRLSPSSIPADHPLVQRLVIMGKTPFGSPTLSDQALLHGIPSLKIGPGQSARSHTADEYILTDEIRQAIHTYTAWLNKATITN